jgi:hypothetical protein
MAPKLSMIYQSHLHGWGPELAAHYFNMNANNAYKVFCCLYNKYYPGRDPMKLRDRITNLTHSLLQQGPSMRERGVGAPPNPVKNLIKRSSSGKGRGIRSNSKWQPFASPAGAQGTGAVQAGTPQTPVSSITARGLHHQRTTYNRLKNQQPGRNHLSVPVIVTSGGRDSRYDKCPGFSISKTRERSYKSKYKCEQCSMEKGYDFWLCQPTKTVAGTEIVVNCHTVPCRKEIIQSPYW